MIFELFIFLTLIVLGLIIVGIVTKHPALILLGAVFMILTGAGLMSEGIRDDNSLTFEKNGDFVSVQDFNSLTTSNDVTVGMVAPLYFYGGFLFVVIALFGVLVAFKQKKSDGG